MSNRKARATKEMSNVEQEARRRSRARKRMLVLGGALGICMLAALGQVGYLQLALSDRLQSEAAGNYVRKVTLDNWRGDIRDRDGALLAATVHRWAISADPSRIDDDEAERAANILADILDRDTLELAHRLRGGTLRSFQLQEIDTTSRLAREIVHPVAEAVANAFDFKVSRFDRKLRLLEYFYRTDQLRTEGVYGLVDTLDNLLHLVESSMDASEKELRFFPTRGRRFVYLARDVDDETARQIEELRDRHRKVCREARRNGQRCSNPLKEIQLSPEPRRYYPKRQLATQILGLVGSDSRGLEGVERAMDGVLTGKEHATKTVRDRKGRSIYLHGLGRDAEFTAHHVELTIDQDIQALAEGSLDKACSASGARAGYAVVMAVKTGEILAAASYPSFNPNTFGEYAKEQRPWEDERRALAQARDDLRWASTWPGLQAAFPSRSKTVIRESWRALVRQTNTFIERQHAFPNAARHSAFQSNYEPGSILKVLTLASWLEEDIRPITHDYPLMDGAWELNDAEENIINDDHTYDRDTADPVYGLKVSSNIVYGQMGLDLGAERLVQYFKSFGLGENTGSGFPGESPGTLRTHDSLTTVDTINVAFGQGVATTGVQLASALSTLGNGGMRMQPLLIRRVLGSDGRELKRWKPTEVERVVSAKTARTTLDVMATVVEPGGTGTKAFIPEYPVGGKTGTGQKPHLRKSGYAENMWVATFFGLAPLDDPELAVVVLVDEPKGKRYGGVIAAPAFREIMRGGLRHLGVPSPYDDAYQAAALDPHTLRERRALAPVIDANVIVESPLANQDTQGEVEVPDFTGLTMDQARRLAVKKGVTARFLGSGTARDQVPMASEQVPVWANVDIHFRAREPHAALTQQVAPMRPGGPHSIATPPNAPGVNR